MSKRDFPTTTMIAISDPMADSEQDKPLLESYAPTAGIMPHVVRAHNELLRIQFSPGKVKQKLIELAEKAATIDMAHDKAYRLLHNILNSLATIASGERKRKLETVRDALMPEGLSGTQASYLSEAGRVKVAASRITPEMETTLRETVVEGYNLYDLYTQWQDAGEQLGQVERERVRLSESEADGAITLSDVQKARFLWVRTMNVLVDIIELDPDAPKELENHILQPLRNAEAKYARKTSKSTEESVPAEADEKAV